MNILNYFKSGLLLSILILSGMIYGQEKQGDSINLRNNAVKIFIDCERCDMNYIREEIPYVNYVRDVKEAHVFIMETSDMTGSGGRKYTYTFVGQLDYLGLNDTLDFSSRPDDTRDHLREQRTQMLKLGLMRYVARTPLFDAVLIDATEQIEKQEVIDRWNNWVFELDAEPNFEGEQSYKELGLRSSVSAVRITHDCKIEIDFDHRYTRTKYNYEDTLYNLSKNSLHLDNLIVKSLGEHWSAGIRLDMLSSTYNNINFRFNLFPSVEYNVFPYAESTHRQLRFLYGIGDSYSHYYDTTIYDRMKENLLQQKLQVAYQVQEKWGSINVSLEGSNYFYDLSKNRLELNGFIQIRIIKGLSLRIWGGVARINDQLSLTKGELSEADILLQIQELETSYQLDGEIGLTYTFGSIYNNIVNPRFGSGRRWFF
jgi:hypothetical protein